MSKAILVIDKPKNCYECSLCAEEVIYGKTEFVCKGYGSIIESLDGNDWCPLRPLPQKLDANDWHRMFSGEYAIREAKGYGYNVCIDEIIGKQE